MNDLIFAFLGIAIAFLLLTQLSVLGSLSQIKDILRTLSSELRDSHHRASTGQLELSNQHEVRRAKYRASAKIRAELLVAGLAHEAIVEDISVTGVAFRCVNRNDLKIHQSYPLKIVLDDNTIELHVRVVRNIGETGVYGGQFEDLSFENKAIIRNHVNSEAQRLLNEGIREDPPPGS